MDLSLVSMQALIEEMMERSEVLVIGYVVKEDVGDPCVYVNHYGNWLKGLGLCDVLKEDLVEKNSRGIPNG